MKCKEVEPLLYLVRDGEITPEEERQVARHLQTCQACRKLYKSVLKMTGLIRQGSFGSDIASVSDVDFDTISRWIGNTPNQHRIRSSAEKLMIIVKGIAASLLVLIMSILAYQEVFYYQQKKSLNVSLALPESPSVSETGKPDCMMELKRKYQVRSVTFIPREKNFIVNNRSMERFAQYVEQICRAETGDVNKLKKALEKSGIIKIDYVN